MIAVRGSQNSYCVEVTAARHRPELVGKRLARVWSQRIDYKAKTFHDPAFDVSDARWRSVVQALNERPYATVVRAKNPEMDAWEPGPYLHVLEIADIDTSDGLRFRIVDKVGDIRQ